MRGPLLVFGATGQLGQELTALATERGVTTIGVSRAVADLADAAAIDRVIRDARPRLVVNAAAYTAVDKAESEPATAEAINSVAPGTIATAAAEHGAPVVHVSTDYVFDGTKPSAYVEDDTIAPLGVYGRTKAEGEAAVRTATPHHVILRTAWVYGIYRANFLKTMLRLAGEKERLRVVADQRGCPTATRDIAEAILAVDAGLVEDPSRTGTFHFAGTGATTWHGFAQAIVAAQAPTTGRNPPVDAITTTDYPTPARRPANSELDSSRFAATFGYRARPWQERTKDIVAHLLAAH